MFKNKTLLITGGTGSFGNSVLKRFITSDLAEIRIFSRDEKKQDDMRKKIKNPKVKFYIGDVRDYRSVENAVRGVNYIFHAAALKQVPTCEFFPIQAVKTNILGTENVLNAAIHCKVEKVVVLSTDKAVYPVNAMGMTKGVMEKVMQAKARENNHTTLFCGTRYGNVMASRGSVIPLFIQQIKRGLPLTVTDPTMTRFLMSLDKAVDLVLFSFKNAKSGDIFVQKAPSSTIGNVAQALLNIYKANNNIDIIGTRHGEKQYESLLTSEEMLKAESIGEYLRIPADVRDLNYEKYVSEGTTTKASPFGSSSEPNLIMDLQQTQELLLQLDIIQNDIEGGL
jgi:UDP-N-acetylglucosamine 4,6-dehydratase/5-epimerase